MTKARDLASGGFGLVLVKPSTVVNGTDNGKGTVSFSAASSVSLNDVFSATYKTYKIVIDEIPTIQADLTFRFRVAGADNSTSNYNRQFIAGNNTTVSAARTTGGSSWSLNGSRLANRNIYELIVNNPAEALVKGGLLNVGAQYDTNNMVLAINSYGFNATTLFDGFTLITGGTMTGSVNVYGYNK